MPKINQKEYEILKGLDDKWKWIARTELGSLKTFVSRPYKDFDGAWKTNDNKTFGIYSSFASHFQFIQWEDEEPYNIAELIEEYEYSTEHVSHVVNERVKALGKVWSESEEKEVKDLGWLKRSIDKRIKTIESDDITFVGSEYYDEGYIDGMRDVLYRINQLDEPEVLSSEWIKDNQLMWTSIHGAEYYVPANKLYGKIVPKQEGMCNGERPDEGEVYCAIGLGGAVEVNVGRSIDEAIEVLTEHETNYSVSIKTVIPQFVADWISEVKPDNSLRVAFEYIAQRK